MKRLLLAMSLIGAFAAGVGAQRTTTGVSMRGHVMDANTIPEEVEYWEVRTATAESIVITGRNDLPIIKWLHRAKGRMVVVSIDVFAADDTALLDRNWRSAGAEQLGAHSANRERGP